MIPTTHTVWLCVTALFAVALPVGLLIWWRKTRKAKLTPFFVGALVFLVFAQALEGALHRFAILGDNAVSRAINGNTWLYVLYGALAAGLFEETGRYAAFRWLLSKRRFPERDTAVTYGIGHGGIESIMLVGVTFALYAVLALCQQSGDYASALSLTKGDAAALAALLGRIGQLTPSMCLWTMLERAAAILLHIALSIYVFLAARDKTQRSYFPFAIALHAVADMPAALYQRGMVPIWAVELWLLVFSLYALRSARKCYLEEIDP